LHACIPRARARRSGSISTGAIPVVRASRPRCCRASGLPWRDTPARLGTSGRNNQEPLPARSGTGQLRSVSSWICGGGVGDPNGRSSTRRRAHTHTNCHCRASSASRTFRSLVDGFVVCILRCTMFTRLHVCVSQKLCICVLL
jgi:hypothetical protein